MEGPYPYGRPIPIVGLNYVNKGQPITDSHFREFEHAPATMAFLGTFDFDEQVIRGPCQLTFKTLTV